MVVLRNCKAGAIDALALGRCEVWLTDQPTTWGDASPTVGHAGLRRLDMRPHDWATVLSEQCYPVRPLRAYEQALASSGVDCWLEQSILDDPDRDGLLRRTPRAPWQSPSAALRSGGALPSPSPSGCRYVSRSVGPASLSDWTSPAVARRLGRASARAWAATSTSSGEPPSNVCRRRAMAASSTITAVPSSRRRATCTRRFSMTRRSPTGRRRSTTSDSTVRTLQHWRRPTSRRLWRRADGSLGSSTTTSSLTRSTASSTERRRSRATKHLRRG